MKRLLVTLTIVFSFASFSSFAEEIKVSAAVLESFQSSFKHAKEVDWTVSEKFYKADFALDGQRISAFYDANGALIAMTRNLTALELPLSLQASLKKKVKGMWISDLFEVSNADGTSYYVSLENADSKVVLKAGSHAEWQEYQKCRKS